MAAKKRKSTKAKKAAVSQKLRAMVEDVERWPLSDQLIKALDELEGAPDAGLEPEPPPAERPPKKKT